MNCKPTMKPLASQILFCAALLCAPSASSAKIPIYKDEVSAPSTQEIAPPVPSAGMGKGLFHARGSNSCMFCHGLGRKKGAVKSAADLTRPKTWKAYQALGGKKAHTADPDAFVAKMRAASIHLIEKGAIRHEGTYKAPAFDWEAIEPYDYQMLGLSGTGSRKWLQTYKRLGVTPEIAAQSLWLYLQSIDRQGILITEEDQ